MVFLFSIENPRELIGNAQMICFDRVERFWDLTSHFSQNFEGKIFGISEFVAGFEYDRWGGDTGIEDIGGEAEATVEVHGAGEVADREDGNQQGEGGHAGEG